MRSLLALAFVLTGGTAVAHAGGGVGIVVTGDATIQPQVAAQLEDWLRGRGNTVVSSPLPADGINALIDCFVIEDMTCARTVVEKQATSAQMVFAKVDLADSTSGMRDITLTAYWFESGMDPIAVRRQCANCTDAAMSTMTDELMSSLAGKGAADVGQVTLSSTPTGAQVVIDGKSVGVTPLTTTLPAGAHAITISLPQHDHAARNITVARGETSEVTVALEPTTPSRRKLPLVLLGTGGALLLSGIVFYASSEEDTGEKLEYRDTKALGVTLSVVGLAAVGVGAYLLLRKNTSPEGPTVALVPGGATIGWGHTF